MIFTGPEERVCPVCKSIFMARTPYAYSLREGNRTSFYCSWSHYRIAEKKHIYQQKNKSKKKDASWSRRLSKEEKTKLISMLTAGFPKSEIALKFEISERAVAYYQQKIATI